MSDKKQVYRKSFGPYLRAMREGQRHTLRGFAEFAGIQAAYLSKIELGQFPPPSEAKLKAIAKALRIDSDVMLAEAGKVSTDVSEAIISKPEHLPKLIRALSKWPDEQLEELLDNLPECKRCPKKAGK